MSRCSSRVRVCFDLLCVHTDLVFLVLEKAINGLEFDEEILNTWAACTLFVDFSNLILMQDSLLHESLETLEVSEVLDPSNDCIKPSYFSIGHALEAIQSLLLHLPTDRQDWIDRCFIRVVSLAESIAAGNRLPDQMCISAIREIARRMEVRGLKCSPEAAHAALIVRHCL